MDTTAVPAASASITTFPNPSHTDDSTNSRDLAMYACGFTTNPGSATSSAIPYLP